MLCAAVCVKMQTVKMFLHHLGAAISEEVDCCTEKTNQCYNFVLNLC